MTTVGSASETRVTWRAMLPAGRAYLAVPSSRDPLIVAEHDRGVLGYVRDGLLACPPRSRMPAWVYAAARQALSVYAIWSLAPRVRAAVDGNIWMDRPGLAESLMSRRRVLLLNHSRDADTRFVLLLFTPGDSSPSIAVKLADVQGANRLHDENARLLWLADIVPDSLRDTVPAVLAAEHRRPAAVLATTAQPGTSMFVALNRRNHTRSHAAVRVDFAAAASWLAELQAVTTGPPVPLDIHGDAFEAARRQLADSPKVLSDVLDGLDALQRRLLGVVAARTVVHGDYWPGNLLVRRGAISGVIDWERAEAAGSPVRDLARFAVTYSTYLDRHTSKLRGVAGHRGLVAGVPGGGVMYAMKGTGWYPSLVRHFVTDGLKRLRLPPSRWRDVMLAEVAAIAAEATDDAFAREQWRAFHQACVWAVDE